MKTSTFLFEVITPCFCGGAEPEKQAEIRAPSIRGHLRWWFRTLGGFKSLAARGMTIRDQESLIFGTTAGNEGRAGRLMLRVVPPQPNSKTANANDLGAGMNTPLGYALFPLRPFGQSDGRRGKISESARFRVSVLWGGQPQHWESICALLAIWGHLGSLGFRGRRGFGALRLMEPFVSLPDALKHFASPGGVQVLKLTNANATNWRSTSAALVGWYRSWRHHGQMNRTWVWNDVQQRSKGGWWKPVAPPQKDQNRAQPGFKYARRDHNEGLDVQGTRAPNPDPDQAQGTPGQTFRPALGLPIIQFFSSLGDSNGPLPRPRATVNWDWDFDTVANKGKGRFASPVLLRPYRDATGTWHALVIFVDAHRWPEGKQVFLNGQPRSVSLDLYNTMKRDQHLTPFP
ncbi:MAG: type III-B CRISPR module RAMP protein Cmr1 [Verrucomicrobia bacterium]|nr:type III-B CRISPR module RAMP protein Cmr1 [Verrucomicrobiota bacterium]